MTTFFSDATEMTSTESGFVKRTGKYFECGKAFTPTSGVPFSVSEAEADAAIAGYAGGKLNLEHKSTVLDNLLGSVDRLWRDGANIMAEYSVPKWLHEATKGEPIKVSSEWDRDTKKPGGAALVLRPAVQDAVMLAAFSEGNAPLDTLLAFAMSRHNTPEGRWRCRTCTTWRRVLGLSVTARMQTWLPPMMLIWPLSTKRPPCRKFTTSPPITARPARAATSPLTIQNKGTRL